MRHPIVSFNAGELSPQIDARSDVDKYASGCRILENMIPRMYGGAERRPGTKFIQETPGKTWLLDFEYSNTIAYMIEASALQFRFYFDGGLLLDGSGDPVTVTTPYLAADIPELQTKQSNDVMWITHPDYAPRKLTRTSATSFSLDVITFTRGPFLPRNDIENDDDVTMTSSVTTGSGTLTASSATFEAGHVGALFKLTQPRVDIVVDVDVVGPSAGETSSAINMEGPFSFTTHGTWRGNVRIERMEDGTNWEVYRTFTGKNDRNIQYSGNESVEGVQYRINVTNLTSGNIGADLTVDTPTQDGIVRVDAFTSDTQVDVTVLADVASTDATIRWYEGAWSAVRGYPTSITFFEERAIYVATAKQPQTTWFSATGDYENFKTPITLVASSSFWLTASSDKRNAIRWISALESLIFGTVGGEWQIRSSSLDQPITPTNFSMKQQTSYGVNTLQALQVGDVLLFVDFVNRKVREITWSDDQRKYVAPDLSALAEHITKTGIVSMAYQRNPDSIVWMTLTNGMLLSMTYQRDQDVIAWAKHPMFGSGDDGSRDEVPAVPAVLPTYEYTYISENGSVWGIPVGDGQMLLTLDPGVAATDVGGGIVSLPCPGNPFVEGDLVRITGSINYNSEFTLTSGTDNGNLQFAATYNAETFTGLEIVVKHIGSLDPSAGRMVQDSDGNLWVGHNWNAGNSTYITKIAPDGTLSYDDLNNSWTSTGSTVRGLAITADSTKLWIYFDNGRLEKWDLVSGNQDWAVAASGWGYELGVDADGTAFVCGGAGRWGITATNYLQRIDTDGNVTNTTINAGVYASIVDNDLGVSITAGSEIAFDLLGNPHAEAANLFVSTFNGSSQAKIAVGGVYTGGGGVTAGGYTYIIGTGMVTTHDGFIYVISSTPTPTIYKVRIDWSGSTITGLTVVKEVAGPTYGVGVYFDLSGNLVVVNQDGTQLVTDVLYFYDTDLNFLSKIEDMYSLMLRTWDQNAGNAYVQGNAVFVGSLGSDAVAAIPAVPASEDVAAIANSVAVIPGPTEDEVWISVTRTIEGLPRHFVEQMQSRDWGDDEDAWFVDSGLKYDMDTPVTTLTNLGHLEGEEVAIYGNGSVFERQTVVGGEITIAEAVTKAIVGLPFRYKLKPMRADVNLPDGGSKGSIKKVTEVVFSFLKAGNVEYGTGVDDLRNIDWRTTEDYDTPPAFFTGDVTVVFDGGFDAEDNVLITGDDPLPCTLRAMVLRGKVTGR